MANKRAKIWKKAGNRKEFAKGNPGGPGNPLAGKVFRIRQLFYDCASDEDLKVVVKRIIRNAKNGDFAAARYLLDRLLGPPVAVDYEARLAEVEKRLAITD